MANSYTQFSFKIATTHAQHAWLQGSLERLEKLNDDDFITAGEWRAHLDSCFNPHAPLDDYYDQDSWGGWLPSIAEAESDDGVRHSTIIYSDDGNADIDLTAAWLSRYLFINDPKGTIYFTYANWSDAPRPGSFGGGACLVGPEGWHIGEADCTALLDSLLQARTGAATTEPRRTQETACESPVWSKLPMTEELKKRVSRINALITSGNAGKRTRGAARRDALAIELHQQMWSSLAISAVFGKRPIWWRDRAHRIYGMETHQPKDLLVYFPREDRTVDKLYHYLREHGPARLTPQAEVLGLSPGGIRTMGMRLERLGYIARVPGTHPIQFQVTDKPWPIDCGYRW